MSSSAWRGVEEKAPARSTLPSPRKSRPKKIVLFLVAGVLIICGAVALYFLIWPFSQKSIVEDLGEASDSSITVGHFRGTFLPHPGCILDDVRFQRGTRDFTFITIKKLTIQGTYLGMLRRHVRRIVAEGAHVFFPALGKGTAFHTQNSKTVVDELIADGAVVEFESANAQAKPLRFDIHKGLLNHVQSSDPILYHLKFHNPLPPGELTVSGSVGPWPRNKAEEIPLSGEYVLDRADLGYYKTIGGFVDSTGKFRGTLQHIDISGTTETNDFEVKSGHHPTRLSTRFDAYVDAMHGDTFLRRVDAHLAQTVLFVAGSIARAQGVKGKLTQLQFTSHQGRIEDILGLFVKAPRSPMSGPISLRAHVEIPSGSQTFLERVNLDGQFGINEGNFTNPDTQTDVNKLSAGARGASKENPETVLTDLKGLVSLRQGTAHFSDLSFRVPGAHAHMHGTYNIVNYRIDLHGKMWVDKNISDTTTGMKSLFLKVMDPFFKKKKKGEVVPVHIEGTYDRPQFGLDLGQQDKSKGKIERQLH
jgi:hypothetical protein